MRGFEDRLSSFLGVILGATLLGGAGCTGVGGDKDSGSHSGSTVDLSGVCDGEAPPTDYQLAFGFVEVAPGDPCPDAGVAQLEVNGCTFLEWQNVTCGLDHLDEDQVFVDDGYGGHYTDVDAVPTGYPTTPVVDVCWYEGVFYLDPNHPTCGRPLLGDDGAPLVAGASPGASPWAGEAAPATPSAAVAAWWLRSALLEHASVASFAVFSLDLLRFGAPPELVRDAHRAAMDEVEHARLCFALAGRYGAGAVGPGPLDAGAVGPRSREDVVVALVREGCVGETLAAVDAAARLRGVTDPVVAAALRVIVRDESDHAALAWRALRWFLQGDDGALRERVHQAFAEERLRWVSADAGGDVSAAERAAGLVPAGERAQALARAWDEVVAPAWAALA